MPDRALVVLKVADDGVGMPAHVRQDQASTLGLQLVTLLVDQLEGELRLSTDKGVAYTITFTPTDGPRDRPANSLPGAIP